MHSSKRASERADGQANRQAQQLATNTLISLPVHGLPGTGEISARSSQLKQVGDHDRSVLQSKSCCQDIQDICTFMLQRGAQGLLKA